MSIRNISLVGKGGRCIGLTTLPPTCADCHEIWESEPPGTLRACTGVYRDCFTYGWVNLHVRCRVLLEPTGFVPCFAAVLGWYHFDQRIRMVLSTVHFFRLASLQFHTESCTKLSQHLTGHRYKYFDIIIFLDSWRRNFVWIRVPFIFLFSYMYQYYRL